ncbi:hypothetical protein QL093DRAFT_1270140 [Fusarium oxysporum]|nr:hypothetical protein QL093DRAFT_1270140 [Fusarium oxysporum]
MKRTALGINPYPRALCRFKISDKEAWNVQHIHPRGKLCVWGGRSRRSPASRRSSIVTKPTVKEAKERRESEGGAEEDCKVSGTSKVFQRGRDG